jgi:integrase
MSVRKRMLPTGRVTWLVDYRDGAGIRRAKQFSTKGAATAFAARAKVEVTTGVHTPDSASIAVAEAATLWLERARREGLERGTVTYYDEHIRLHIVPLIGDLRLSRLSVPTLSAFRNRLLDSGRSPDMTRRVLTSLSGIIANAQRMGLVAFNNMRLVERVRRVRSDRRPVMPSREELRAILAAAQAPRDRVVILLALFAGLRGSEIRGLIWGDVDLKAGVIHIRRRADRYNRLGAPKSRAGIRDIPTGALLLNALKVWRVACPVNELELVLPAADGGIEQHVRLLRHVFWPAQIAAGVTLEKGGEVVAKYALHALRHAAAALWIEAGFNAKQIQTWLGHATIQETFDRYGYLFDTGKDEQRAELDRLAVRLVE